MPTLSTLLAYVRDHSPVSLRELNTHYGLSGGAFRTPLEDLLDRLVENGAISEEWPKDSPCVVYRV
jgi:hypothetical protein